MTDELDVATNLLNSALDRYSKVCSRFRLHYLPGLNVPLESRVLTELSLVRSYENEIRESKAIISRLDNLSNPHSINSFPPEVLKQIFEMVCDVPCPRSASYGYFSSSKSPMFSKDPVTLSHVCFHWRQIMFNSGNLWSHIDLVPNQFQVPSLAERANAYIARSGLTSLDIHILESSKQASLREPSPIDDDAWDEFELLLPQADPDFLHVLVTIAPRMRSLTVVHTSTPGTIAICYSILSTCFSNCVPDRLLSVSLDVPAATHTYPEALLLAQPEPTLEALWRPVKVLRLKGFYPVWISQAYHGLVELDLTGKGSRDSIPESTLVLMLKSSPGLRVLKLYLEITNLTPRDIQVEPVRLVDLEQLNVSGMIYEDSQLGFILRLIAPGPKPLRMTVFNPWLGSTREDPIRFTSRPETQRFFARSNVTHMRAFSFENYKQLANVLSMAPSVRVLVLDRCLCRRVPEHSALPAGYTLDELYVMHSSDSGAFTWSSIERMVEKHRVRKLTLWKYDHRFNGLGESGRLVVPDNLYTLCPVVNIVPDESPNPIEDWE